MPKSAPRPCSAPGCGVLVHDGSGRCAKHARAAWVKAQPTKRITGRRLQAMRAALFARSPLCAECERQGRVTPATERDHIVPLAEGGADDDTNVQGLCHACHEEKRKAESTRGQRRARGIPPPAR
ncbi:HNH endonuclease [Ottowia sp. GY511]|uniref:HNH endonuclease n=1 Tax=Ottowia flava TaxID=2675430 RepID=A0ABW4KS05_9BURK|nr:HNH endonuclease signature motif containing protein [Ottowia sp. GY511]TXK26380.1 HNH endonuclease [Ottowia sp. GY511]